MPAPTPPNSLPPPSPPPEVFARARVRALQRELETLDEPRGEALLHYELGALHELRLDDRGEALAHYRAASRCWPRFLPALLSQATLLERLERPADAADAWRAFAQASLVPRDRASALCELGILQSDALDDGDAAIGAWSEALRIDPSCIAAALLIEQERRARGETDQAELAVGQHLRAATDPHVEVSLLLELALSRERAGVTDRALALLDEARELGVEPLAVWMQLERLARQTGEHAARVDALGALASHAAALADLGAGDWARGRASALHREGARVALRDLGDSDAAMAGFAAALALRPGDPLVLRERMQARRAAGDTEGAIEDARRLLGKLARDDQAAPGLRRELALLLRDTGDEEGALSALSKAATARAHSTRAQLDLQDELRRLGRFQALCEHHRERARNLSGAARAERMLHAGRLAMVHDLDADLALAILRDAVDACDDDGTAIITLRELYGAALRHGRDDYASMVLRELTKRPVQDQERAVLRLHDYLLQTRRGSPQAGLQVLERVIDDPACATWAPAIARVAAAQNRRYGLLAKAHRVLAGRAGDAPTSAAHLAAAARAALRDSDRQQCERDLRDALAHVPDDTYALTLLEWLLLQDGEAAEASRLLREAASHNEGARERVLSLLHAAAAAEAARDWEGAARSYDEAASLGVERLSPAWARLRLADRRGDGAARARALEALCAIEAERGPLRSAHLELAETRIAEGEPLAALPLLEQALGTPASELAAASLLALLPGSAPGNAWRGALERLDGAAAGELRRAARSARVDEALRRTDSDGRALLEDARAARPDDPELLLSALLHARDGTERTAALRALGRASKDGESGAELLLHAVRCGLLSRAPELEADALVRAMGVSERAPRSLAAAVALDETLLGGDDAESRASALFARLAHTTPECAPALRAARTRALLASGRAREAADEARRVLGEAPEDRAAWEILREAGSLLGDWEMVAEAAERLSSWIAGPQRAALLEEAAIVYSDELDDPRRARRALEAALEADPARRSAFDRLHDMLLEEDQLEALRALLERHPDLTDDDHAVELAHERALLWRAQGEHEACLSACDELLSGRPDHAEGLALRAELLRHQARFEDAVSTLRRLASAEPSDEGKVRARVAAADVLEHELDAPAEARAELAAAPSRAADDPERWLRMGRLARRAGDFRSAVEDYRRAAAEAPRARAAELEQVVGQLLQRELGDRGAAAAAYRRALEARPTHAPALRALLEVLDAGDGARDGILERFITAVREELTLEPENPTLLRALEAGAALMEDGALARRALTTLRALGLADDGELDHLEAMPASNSPDAGALLEAQSELLDPAVHAIARLVAPRTDSARGGDGDGIAEPTRDALAALAVLAGVSVEGMVATGGDTIELEGAGALSWSVGKEARAPSTHVRFELLCQLCAARLGVLPALRGPREARARRLEVALAAGTPAGKHPPGLEREARALSDALSRRQRKELAQLVQSLDGDRARCELYLDRLERVCERVALLLCDDPADMLAARAGDGDASAPPDLDTLAASPRALDLLRFWLGGDGGQASERSREAAP